MKTREQIIADNPIERELRSRGVELKQTKDGFQCRCPFHEDKNPSFSVNSEKRVWHCHAGCGGGSIIDLIAKFDGCSVADVLKRLGDEPERAQQAKPTIEKVYSYTDAMGREVFQALRLKPKSFRQRHTENGKWVWNMDGVSRVLYRLPEVVKASCVWIVEGEKDADTLADAGICATTNVGGAGKWLAAYTESLEGKEVVICGDNDKPGQDHANLVFESIAGKVKSARVVKVPAPHKDVTDYSGEFQNKADFRAAMDRLAAGATVFTKGISLPIYSLAELETKYIEHVKATESAAVDLGKWLPTLGLNVRKLVPGELVAILADTGVGKTFLLQNLAVKSAPLPTVLFELELPPELLFERFVSIGSNIAATDVEREYRSGNALGEAYFSRKTFRHIHVCTEARMDTKRLEQLINKSELKLGERPKLVLLDYIGLMQGSGKSRYERMSDTAEQLKVVAKETQTVIVMASQIHRTANESPEIFLHDAKDSSSIEQSSGLILGAWRDEKDSVVLHLKVLKNTKGKPGVRIECKINGETGAITEKSRFDD